MQELSGLLASASLLESSVERIHFAHNSTIKASVDEVKERVEFGFLKRTDGYLKSVFDRLATDGRLSKEALRRAMLELQLGHLDDDSLNAFFLEVDIDHSGFVELDEFLLAALKPTKVATWAKAVPWWQIIVDALPAPLETDSLRAVSELSSNEIDIICDGVLNGLKRMLKEHVEILRKSYVCMDKNIGDRSVESVNKFKTFKPSHGLAHDFHRGLEDRVGNPHIKFLPAMVSEHCARGGHDHQFTTGNYLITTTPEREWKIVMGEVACFDVQHGRQLKPLDDYMELNIVAKAELCREEVIAIVLYTGPMFEIYNAILRKFPVAVFDVFQAARNLFPTTINVLVSGVQKLSRVIRIAEGTPLYRGLGGLMELPDCFFRFDEFGRRGYTEWGFLSTTSRKSVALQYSGVREGRPSAMVLYTQSTAIDRGACVVELSQYPQEVEYLFPPLSFLQLAGDVAVECTEDGPVTMVPVRVNANNKSLTVEAIQAQKKSMHLASFDFLLNQLARDLGELAASEEAAQRARRDPSTHKVSCQDLVDLILKQCREVRDKHEREASERYNDDDSFYRLVVGELLAVETMAKSKLGLWLQGTEHAEFLAPRTLVDCQRRSMGAEERRVRKLEGAARRDVAAELCRRKGLFRDSPEELNAFGEMPLLSAAANGERPFHLRLLVWAGAGLAAANADGETAVLLAALNGHANAIQELAALRADINAVKHSGATPLHSAAYQGHRACIVVLLDHGANVRAADESGVTPIYAAAWGGHAEVVALLAERKGDPASATRRARTPAFAAAHNGHDEALAVLLALGVNPGAAADDGGGPLHAAARNGHTAAVRQLVVSGAAVDGTNAAGCTPVWLAAEGGHAEAVAALVELGADLARADTNGVTPLAAAAARGHVEVARALAASDAAAERWGAEGAGAGVERGGAAGAEGAT